MDNWKQEQLWLTIIYRILECKEQIPLSVEGTTYAFIDKDLEEMHHKDLLGIGEDQLYWAVTEKGEAVRDSMLAVYDQSLKFEIFGTVHLGLELPSEICEEGEEVLDHYYDPRFDPEIEESAENSTEDVRLAMMEFLSAAMSDTEELKGLPDLDPHRIVFMQMLAEGKLRHKDIWFDLALGKFFSEVDEIVEGKYSWMDVAETEEESREVMQYLYTCGMLEQRKRDGQECTGCGIPLAVFQYNTSHPEEGEPKELNCCPNPECGADFTPPVPDTPEYECPACQATVCQGQTRCNCGALLDFSMPPGTISQTLETTEEVEKVYDDCVWGGYYGYTPYGYYDPYDPYIDALAFATVCAVLW